MNMKTIQFYLLIMALLTATIPVAAQKEKTETFKVSGECNMCKKKIESAAKQAGASYAFWSPKTKILKVSYNHTDINTASIQQTIANAGYDTPGFKASDSAYKALDECCQYKRDMKSARCCDKADCKGDEAKMKANNCADMSSCKEADCCKKSS